MFYSFSLILTLKSNIMIQKKICKILSGSALCIVSSVAAQHFQTMPVQSGYTEDVIANGLGSSMTSTTNNLDGTYYNLVAKDFKLTPTSANLSYGMPTNGIINSAMTPGLKFQLGDLSGNNSLRLRSITPGDIDNAGTLVFSNPVAAFKIYMLATSGQGTSYVTATINFTDNTTQSFTQEIPFWSSTRTNYAIRGVGKINRNTDELAYDSSLDPHPKLYQTVHNIDVANQTKLIKSITVKKVSPEGYANIFAFSADAYTDCFEPILQAANMITSNSAQVSWTVPAGTQAVSYDIYYSTNPTPPTSSTVPNYSGITGTSFTLGNLSAITQYYYWVRTNCNGMMSQSGWSSLRSFTTLCGVTVPPYSNDFNDAGYLAFPGKCWKNNLSGGTPATGPTGTDYGWAQSSFLNISGGGNTNLGARDIMSGTNEIAWLMTPIFDLSNGGYQVKFKYGVTTPNGVNSTTMGVDDVVYFMVSNDGGNVWTILKTWNVSNGPSNLPNDYIYNLTGNTSTTTRFAFYSNTGTIGDYDYSFHVDDFTIENSIQLSTSEVSGKVKKGLIHPNPFKDNLYLSETKEIKKIIVEDESGRIVKTIEGSAKAIDLSMLNYGLYFVTLHFKDGSQSTIKAMKK